LSFSAAAGEGEPTGVAEVVYRAITGGNFNGKSLARIRTGLACDTELSLGLTLMVDGRRRSRPKVRNGCAASSKRLAASRSSRAILRVSPCGQSFRSSPGAFRALSELLPDNWTAETGKILVMSPAGRTRKIDEEIEVQRTADCVHSEAG